MAKIIADNQEREVPDGSNIQQACEELGVMFGCQSGFCRSCEITVLEGYENLSEMGDAENFIGLQKPRRLACQCKIKSGTIRIKFE